MALSQYPLWKHLRQIQLYNNDKAIDNGILFKFDFVILLSFIKYFLKRNQNKHNNSVTRT